VLENAANSQPLDSSLLRGSELFRCRFHVHFQLFCSADHRLLTNMSWTPPTGPGTFCCELHLLVHLHNSLSLLAHCLQGTTSTRPMLASLASTSRSNLATHWKAITQRALHAFSDSLPDFLDNWKAIKTADGKGTVGGVNQLEASSGGPHYLSYVEVENADAANAKAKKLGAVEIGQLRSSCLFSRGCTRSFSCQHSSDWRGVRSHDCDQRPARRSARAVAIAVRCALCDRVS